MHKCPQCDHILWSAQTLQSHILNQHSPKTYKCSQCEKMFVTAEQAKKHWDEQHSVNEQVCEICEKTIQNEYLMRRHFEKCKKKQVDSWKCPDCDKVIDGD